MLQSPITVTKDVLVSALQGARARYYAQKRAETHAEPTTAADEYRLSEGQSLWQAVEAVGTEAGVLDNLPERIDSDDIISKYLEMYAVDTTARPPSIEKQKTVDGLRAARTELEKGVQTPVSSSPQVSQVSPMQSAPAPAEDEVPEPTASQSQVPHAPAATAQGGAPPHPDVVSRRDTQSETHEYIADALKNIDAPTHPRGIDRSRDIRGDFMNPEVTEGLQQLLEQDWKYFTKSGFLGRGPNGTEHPTYKKIRDLPVQLVIDGRWDSADLKLADEVRQFVHSWRREEGVAPEEDESFERYLRRVVQTILVKRREINQRTS